MILTVLWLILLVLPFVEVNNYSYDSTTVLLVRPRT